MLDLVDKNFEKHIEELVKNTLYKVVIGVVSDKLINTAKEYGFDIRNYSHNIDISGIRHTLKRHGEGRETNKKQIPVTRKNIKEIPNIIYDFDEVSFGAKDKKGINIIKYQKFLPKQEIVYFEEIRTGKKTLTLKTMYIKSR